jgi:HemY protein
LTRLILILAFCAALAAATVWVADRPGALAIDWRGWRVETTVSVALAGLALLMAAAAVLDRLWWWLRRGPLVARSRREAGRRQRGYLALTQGMVAVAAGDAREAKRLARRAQGLLDEPPLTMLLSAQAAQLGGDEVAARRAFEAMLERPETEFLGLRGLTVQALRAGERGRALELVRHAYGLRPETPWVLTACFELEAQAGHWEAAEGALGAAVKVGAIADSDGRRQRAVVLYGQALAADGESRAVPALALASRAHELAADLVPAAVLAARLAAAAGKKRRAAKIVEAAWAAAPHPDLAKVYDTLEVGEERAKRVARIERLAAIRADHPESRIAVARAAIAAALWGIARTQLGALVEDAPEARVCRLMAALEAGEGRDPAAEQAWLLRLGEARSDPAWRCGKCGHRAEGWAAHCANCEAFDTLHWGAPRAAAPPAVSLVHAPTVTLSLGATDPAPPKIDGGKRRGLA